MHVSQPMNIGKCYMEFFSYYLIIKINIMTDLTNIKPEDLTTIKVEGSKWNCDKCVFFNDKECSCLAHKRLLYGQAIGDDCLDCEFPFVFKNSI